MAAIVIGRNEGARLERCLRSVLAQCERVVYVDSGSSDGSPDRARRLGAQVVELDPAQPFSAARARNAGVAELLRLAPATQAAQLVDGDCELAPGWIARARRALAEDPARVVVVGRVSERFPDRSVYERLCALEWEAPVGEVESFGGIAYVKLAALLEVGGYATDMIAGEEPELAGRLRDRGGRILRVSDEMVVHEADLQRFGQWWRRSVRAGHALAEGTWRRRGRSPYPLRRLLSPLALGLGLPLAALALAPASSGLSLLALGLWPLQAWRIARGAARRGMAPADARLLGAFTVLGKLPQALGALRFAWGQSLSRPAGLIEYKPAPASSRKNQ